MIRITLFWVWAHRAKSFRRSLASGAFESGPWCQKLSSVLRPADRLSLGKGKSAKKPGAWTKPPAGTSMCPRGTSAGAPKTRPPHNSHIPVLKQCGFPLVFTAPSEAASYRRRSSAGAHPARSSMPSCFMWERLQPRSRPGHPSVGAAKPRSCAKSIAAYAAPTENQMGIAGPRIRG